MKARRWWFLLLGCLGLAALLPKLEDVASAVTSNGDIRGFEVAADWTTTTAGATIGLSTTHTQGVSSLAVHPSSTNGWTPLFSARMSTLSAVSPTIAVDVMLPTQQANPSWFGAVQMYLNCPSHNIYSAYLAQVELTGMPLGVWKTLTFPVTGSLVSSLLSAGYTDLTVEITLNVAVPTAGKYLFDNLRFLPVAGTNCTGQPNGTLCNDNSVCTQADVCENGVCIGTDFLSCNDDNVCTADSCDAALGCVHTAIACNVRSGQIEAETFDSSSNVTASPTFVTPTASGAWIQFGSVDFGAPGTSGRFEASLLGSPGDRHLELRLDAPNGTLVADLDSLPSPSVGAVSQGTDFLVPESGIHTVFVVFDSSDVGSVDWFRLTKAQGTDKVSDFPSTFQHTNPGQPFDFTHIPVATEEQEENDVPAVIAFSPPSPITIPGGRGLIVPLQLSETLIVVGQARWSGSNGNLMISVLDLQGNVIAIGGGTAVPGGWRADVKTPPLPSQKVGMIFTNTGTDALSGIQIYAGAVR
jgi:hypothetical protein